MREVKQILGKSKKKGGLLHFLKKDYDLYLLLLPGILLILIFNYIPIYGLQIAFRDFNAVDGISGSPFVGFKHFFNFFNDPYFFRLLRNTVMLGLYSLLWGFWPPVLFALLLNELSSAKFKKTVQSISYLPYFLSMVVVTGIIFRLLAYDGIVNTVIKSLGFASVSFFSTPEYFRTIYIASTIWQSVGWGAILYLATIAGIDPGLYEACIVDGGSRLQRAVYITLPGLMPTMSILFILNVGVIISVEFERAFLLQNPAIYETADVIATYVYRRGIEFAQYSYASAIGLFNSVIAFILVISTNKVAKSLSEYSLW